MKNIHKTLIFTAFLALLAIISAFVVQTNANTRIVNCSYLDPASIDILAFLAAAFLLLEGAYRIHQHKKAPLSDQWTRSFRIALACSIITLHALQAVVKV